MLYIDYMLKFLKLFYRRKKMKFKQSLLLISMVLISLMAISAVSAADNTTDVVAVPDADDSDALSVDDGDNLNKADDGVDDSEKLGSGFGSGGNKTFNFGNITFNTGNGTSFNLGDLLNGTFTLGNGTTFNFSSLGNGTISFGANGTKFNFTDMFNSTGNGTFDISSILNMFGGTGSKLTATTADIEQVYSGPVTFEATILQSNKTVESGKDVIFTINNNDYIKRTNENGTASLSLDLKAGTYYIYTEYNNEILAKNQIVVKKAASKITASAKNYKATAKTKKYVITLKNNNGKAIKKAKVTLKVNGKTYTATTGSNGKATFKLTLNKKGKFTATVKFAGNGYYKSSSASKKITIK